MFRKIAILLIVFLESLDEPSKSFTPQAENYLSLGCWRMLTRRPRDWLLRITPLYLGLTPTYVPLGPVPLIYKENFKSH